MSTQSAVFNWSGGKDSAMALHLALQDPEIEVQGLLTTLSVEHKRITMHGVRRELLVAQAAAIDLPLQEIYLSASTSMEAYNALMHQTWSDLKAKGVATALFGDIFLEDLRNYREAELQAVGVQAAFPLWKRDTKTLVKEFIDLGFKTVVVAAQAAKLDASFTGRVIDHDFLKDLPADVDPCGENGEFHTFVFDGPIFKEPVSYELGERIFREYPSPTGDGGGKPYGVHFCELELGRP